MPRKNQKSRPAAHSSGSATPRLHTDKPGSVRAASSPPTVSGRWLLMAIGMTLAAAAACAWGVLCLLFWQGSWQLLYHPASAVTRTPANAGLAFDQVGFATTEADEPRPKVLAVPRRTRRTFQPLHSSLSARTERQPGRNHRTLAALHNVGVNVLAFDYRGYGQSQFVHPSEARWRADANWALEYLTGTRHIASGSIVLDGRDLGANLALEMGAEHPELAGIVLESPIEAAVNAIFNDPRARMVPAHVLVRDRYDLNAPAAGLRIPSLWFYRTIPPGQIGVPEEPVVFERVTAPKMLVWLADFPHSKKPLEESLARWLDDLPSGDRPRPAQVILK